MPAIFRAVAVTLLLAALVATYDSSIHAQGVKPATTNAQSTQDIDRDVADGDYALTLRLSERHNRVDVRRTPRGNPGTE